MYLVQLLKQSNKKQSNPEPQNDPRVDELSESTNRMADQLKQIALNELSRVHNDWRSVASWNEKEIPGVGKVIHWNNPAFGEWVGKQDDDIQDVVYKSDDIAAIANVITKFKNESKPAQQQETTTQNKSKCQQEIRKSSASNWTQDWLS